MKRVLKLSLFAAALAIAIGGPASAVLKTDLGLTQTRAACSGRAVYGYDLTWSGGKSAAFQVNTGNQCKLSGAVCGISNKDCHAACDAAGHCSAHLDTCLQGKGAAWAKVVAMDGSVYQQIASPAPARCLN